MVVAGELALAGVEAGVRARRGRAAVAVRFARKRARTQAVAIDAASTLMHWCCQPHLAHRNGVRARLPRRRRRGRIDAGVVAAGNNAGAHGRLLLRALAVAPAANGTRGVGVDALRRNGVGAKVDAPVHKEGFPLRVG